MSRRPTGFTMIELMAVVAIIGVLIMLLLPAVQSAREAARRCQCVNNLIQLGIAAGNYESTHRVLPPGAVDVAGPVVESPAAYQFGWIAQVLPFLEQKNVHRHLDFNVGVYGAGNLTARSVSMNVLLCPSASYGRNSSRAFTTGLANSQGNIPGPASSSYAACHHDLEAPIDANNNGVFFLNSRIRTDEIEDGAGFTIFFGEKHTGGDELGWASGTRATLRNTGTPINRTSLDPTNLVPFMAGTQEIATVSGEAIPGPGLTPRPPTPIAVGGFGSDHKGGANFAFGDGSVRFVSASIHPRIFRLLGNRADGEPIGNDQF